MQDQISGYPRQYVEKLALILYSIIIYVELSLHIFAVDSYHCYLNQPQGGSVEIGYRCNNVGIEM